MEMCFRESNFSDFTFIRGMASMKGRIGNKTGLSYSSLGKR